MENWYFLFAAYTVVWLGVSFYVFVNSKKQKAVERRLEHLESRLAGRRQV